MIGSDPQERAYIGPFAVFLAIIFLGEAVGALGDGYAHWMLSAPRYWVYPLQTIICGLLLWRWRKSVTLRPYHGFVTATVIGLVSLVIWIAPQEFFKVAPRTEGFDPAFFGESGLVYWLGLIGRFARLVIIVPLVEEVFWRGFLLRYLINEDFRSVRFGTFSWKSFAITNAAFCLEHQPPDWPAALLTGALFNFVAYRTRSLAACVVTHAVTNLALGLWVMKTGQWGFW